MEPEEEEDDEEEDDDEDEEERIFNRTSGFGYAKKVQKLKREYIPIYESLTGKIQEGIKIHVDFHYLLNTDLNLIFRQVRESILETILEKSKEIEDSDLREELLSYFKERKPLIITLNIEQISTEKCVDILITLGVIEPLIKDVLLPIANNINAYLIIESYKRLKNKNLMPKRGNLKKITRSRVKYKRYKNGATKIIKEVEKFEYK